MSQQQPNQPIVHIERISKRFQEGEKERIVLADLTATFNHGEFIAILGPSGSGKSTLLNLVSGIDMPSSGDIFVQNLAINQLSDKERTLFRRDHIGFVFQFFNLIPTLTVLENIILPQELAGKQRRDIEGSAMALLERVGLADRRDAFPDKLSGGEQQRIAIARALAHDPTLILADEPTGNLDEKTGKIVLDLLLGLTEEAGKTLIMATHSPTIVPLADRVLEMQGNRLVERSSPEQAETSAVESIRHREFAAE